MNPEGPLCQIEPDDANLVHGYLLLPVTLPNITLAHCDAVGRGYPAHQFWVEINTFGAGLALSTALLHAFGVTIAVAAGRGLSGARILKGLGWATAIGGLWVMVGG